VEQTDFSMLFSQSEFQVFKYMNRFYIFQIFFILFRHFYLKIKLQASADLVVSTAQVSGVHQQTGGQLGAAVEWSGVTQRQLTVVPENEGVAGSAAAGLLTSNGQAGSAAAVADRSGELQVGVDLVVEDGGEIVVQGGFHGGVDLAARPVGFELLGFYGSVEAEADFGSDVGRTVGENGVGVQSALGVGVHVEVDFIVTPGELELVKSWDGASGHWPAGAGGDFGNVVVFELDVGDGFGWVQSFLDSESACEFVFSFERRGDGVALECALGGDFESVGFAAEFYFVVGVLEAFVEKVIAFLGEIAVFDWHGC